MSGYFFGMLLSKTVYFWYIQGRFFIDWYIQGCPFGQNYIEVCFRVKQLQGVDASLSDLHKSSAAMSPEYIMENEGNGTHILRKSSLIQNFEKHKKHYCPEFI